MKKTLFMVVIVYSFLFLSGRVYGIGERTVLLGAASSWQAIERRQGVIEAPLIRPHPVLLLSGSVGNDPLLDLHLTFNEGQPERFADSRGRYDVFVSPALRAAPAPWSRVGAGAALFSGTGSVRDEPLTLRPRHGALFAPGSHIRDFSIEFWLYPQTIENGAQILSWASYKPDGRGDYVFQRIQSIVARNRLQWTFGDFFSSPCGREHRSLTLSGPPLLPRAWSHHLIRFDAEIGLLEYWVDGELEAVGYATSSGREGGEVYTPIIGQNGSWTFGARFSGMMDEFRVHRRHIDNPALTQFPSRGGRVESRTLDLGRPNSRLLKIEAFGGRTTNIAGTVRNEYAGNRGLSFPDHSAVNFFVRTSNELYRWNDSPWIPVRPGADLPDTFRGRFVQVAADFYPSADGQTSPYLSELRVIYHAAEPPPPPTRLVAVARDGAVELSWRASLSREIGGYLVYFGTAPGEYFGEHAIMNNMVHSSPIDVGNRTSVRIEGLTNGTLYFFAVAAYGMPGDWPALPEPGEFSREVAARPLRMAE